MRLGLMVGYSGAQISIDMNMIHEAERSGFDSVWTAEAWGSDAVSPARVDRRADEEDQARHRDHAAARALARQHGDDGDDARRALGRPLHPRASARRGRRSSRAGTACRSTSRSRGCASTSTIVRADPRAREAARVRRRALPDPVPRPGRDRPRQAAEEHPPRPQGHPDLHRLDGAQEPGAERRDRRRPAPHVHAPRALRRHRAATSRRASRRPAAARASPTFDVAPTVAVHRRRRSRRVPHAAQDEPRALHRRHGGAGEELLQRVHPHASASRRRPSKIQDLYLAGKKDEAIAAVPDELVDALHLVGPPERIRERFAGVEGAAKVGTLIVGTAAARGGAPDGRARAVVACA